jgi:DNA-directed RNA polymerase specialized sigma24 family protein
MARNNFLDQIRKRQEATKEPEPTEAKPTEQMTDDELQQALDKARRDLLDAQHAELREREIARV